MKRLATILAALALAACQGDAPQPLAPSDGAESARASASQMQQWFGQASPEALAVPGAVFADYEEDNNRLAFGVEHAAAARGVQQVLARLQIPSSAYVIVTTEPIRHAATLRDRFRPTIGGIQIHFGQFVCTLGFNATHASTGERSFITNSHCTDQQGGVESTAYFQPISSASEQIATEVADPAYFRGGVCPRGRKCRYSDSARALYASGTASDLGRIARTSGPNNGSLTVDDANPTFSIAGEGSASVGTVVNKVGRTTGWTQGKVSRTCVDTNVSGSNITQLCQTFVDAGVDGGDSGSPVFIQGGTSVTLVGILWGGSSSGASYVYSPIGQVERELGSLGTS